MFIVFFGGVVVADPPLTAVQMLWVNLIMDTMAALALATEPPSDDLLKEKPYNRSELIVTPTMWRNIIGQAIFQIVVLIVLLFYGKKLFGLNYTDDTLFYEIVNDVPVATEKTEHYTIIFNAFVFMQIFNEINSRKLGAKEYNVFAGFFNNFLFIGIIIFTIGVQYVLVQYAGQPLRCSPLSLNEHIICCCIGLFSFIQAILVKAFLPVSWFEKLHMKEEAMSDEEEKEAFTTVFRKSFRSSIKNKIDAIKSQ
jgi:Ca2+ transporting ATPase